MKPSRTFPREIDEVTEYIAPVSCQSRDFVDHLFGGVKNAIH
jgi:hypothetical protein